MFVTFFQLRGNSRWDRSAIERVLVRELALLGSRACRLETSTARISTRIRQCGDVLRCGISEGKSLGSSFWRFHFQIA